MTQRVAYTLNHSENVIVPFAVIHRPDVLIETWRTKYDAAGNIVDSWAKQFPLKMRASLGVNTLRNVVESLELTPKQLH